MVSYIYVAGFFAGKAGENVGCKACPLGFYQTADAGSSCFSCIPGKIGNVSGLAKDCSDCF